VERLIDHERRAGDVRLAELASDLLAVGREERATRVDVALHVLPQVRRAHAEQAAGSEHAADLAKPGDRVLRREVLDQVLGVAPVAALVGDRIGLGVDVTQEEPVLLDAVDAPLRGALASGVLERAVVAVQPVPADGVATAALQAADAELRECRAGQRQLDLERLERGDGTVDRSLGRRHGLSLMPAM
jgi:hypothetical protein